MALFGPPNVAALAERHDVKGLIRALGMTSVRYNAAVALGQVGGAEAVPPLIAVLNDPDPAVRQASVWALGRLGDTRALEPLIGRLAYDESPEVHDGAMDALHAFGPAAVEALIAALYAQDVDVREAAARALGRLGDARAVDSLTALLPESPGLFQKVNIAAAEALGRLGDARAVEPLTAALQATSFRTKEIGRASAEALGHLGGPRAIESLVTALTNVDDSDVRDACVDALVEIGSPAVEALIGAVQDDRGLARYYATETLGRIGDPRAVELLTQMLHDDVGFSDEVVTALGQIGDPRAVGPLAERLRTEAVRWVGFEHQAPILMAALGRLGVPAVEPLIEALHVEGAHRGHEFADHYLAEALGRLGVPAVEPLIEALHDPDAFVRCVAAEALGRLGDTRALPALLAGQADADELVGATAAGAVRSLGHASAFDPRQAALRDTVEPLLGVLYDSCLARKPYWYTESDWLRDRGNEHAFDELVAVMERSATEMDADLLRWVCGIPDDVSVDTGWDVEEGLPDHYTMDFRTVTQPARDEMLRRALPSWGVMHEENG